MTSSLRRIARITRLLLLILISPYYGLGASFSRSPEQWAQRFFQNLLRALGIRLHTSGPIGPQPALVVGNHQSWLDIAVLAATKPVIFVSKAEVANWPLIGWLARSGSTLFIERGAHGTSDLNQQISTMLARGRCVVMFPEGTTTRGPGVRRFQPRLFAGAIEQQCPIVPFALRYSSERAPYVDNQTLAANLWDVLAEPVLQVDLHFGEDLPAGDARKAIAAHTQDWVEQALRRPAPWDPHTEIPTAHSH